MELDHEVCLCFHVTKRKVLKFIRLEKPSRASQLSECYGAGTGCGWCRSYLEKLLAIEQKKRTERLGFSEGSQVPPEKNPVSEGCQSEIVIEEDTFDSQQYARQRAQYIKDSRKSQ